MKTRLSVLVLGFILVVVLGLLATTIGPFPGEKGTLVFFEKHQSPWVDPFVSIVSIFGSRVVAVLLTLAMCVLLLMFRKYVQALLFLLILVPDGMTIGIKELIGRERPMFQVGSLDGLGPSFPSGHVVHAVLFLGMIFIMLNPLIHSILLRRVVRCILIFGILAVGVSRVYTGAHWPTDVLGGYIFAVLCIIILNSFYQTLGKDYWHQKVKRICFDRLKWAYKVK